MVAIYFISVLVGILLHWFSVYNTHQATFETSLENVKFNLALLDKDAEMLDRRMAWEGRKIENITKLIKYQEAQLQDAKAKMKRIATTSKRDRTKWKSTRAEAEGVVKSSTALARIDVADTTTKGPTEKVTKVVNLAPQPETPDITKDTATAKVKEWEAEWRKAESSIPYSGTEMADSKLRNILDLFARLNHSARVRKGIEDSLARAPPSISQTTWAGRTFIWYVLPAEGYLGEQFSQQRLAVMETIHFVKALGPKYTLVEPMFIITPHNNTAIQELMQQGKFANSDRIILGRYVIRYGELYNLAELRNYFEWEGSVISFDDFQKELGGKMEIDILMMDHGPNKDEPAMKLSCLTTTTVGKEQEFFRLPVLVKSSFCQKCIRKGGYPITTCSGPNCYMAGKLYREAFVKAHQSFPPPPAAKPRVIGHYLWRSVLSHYLYMWLEDKNLDYIEIKKHMTFSDKVWRRVLVVVDQLPRPYLCVHLRRGDKVANHDPHRSLKDWSKVVQRINRIATFTNVRDVFLMTDMTSVQVKAFKKQTNGLNISQIYDYENGRSKNWKYEVQDMFAEMGVCTLADYFIPSDRAYWASTTPSRDIIETRNLYMGYSKYTTFWIGKPGDRIEGDATSRFTHNKDVLL